MSTQQVPTSTDKILGYISNVFWTAVVIIFLCLLVWAQSYRGATLHEVSGPATLHTNIHKDYNVGDTIRYDGVLYYITKIGN